MKKRALLLSAVSTQIPAVLASFARSYSAQIVLSYVIPFPNHHSALYWYSKCSLYQIDEIQSHTINCLSSDYSILLPKPSLTPKATSFNKQTKTISLKIKQKCNPAVGFMQYRDKTYSGVWHPRIFGPGYERIYCCSMFNLLKKMYLKI